MACPLDKFLISRCRHCPHVIKEFIRFLMTYDVYGRYVLNYANASDYWKQTYHREGDTPTRLLLRAFFWEKTPEGNAFWSDLNELWRNRLKFDFKIE